MSMKAGWIQLKVSQPSLPKLFVKLQIQASGYNLVLTDLSHIWQESLSEAQILARADDDGCSINPREDQEQLPILLENIREALKGARGTSVTVGSDKQVHNLSLSAYVPLPTPLPALTWQMRLIHQSAALLSSEVICPLLFTAQRQQGSIEHLLDHLREKDRLITRLLDKLETSGTDLTTVFPGISNIKLSRKTSQRSQLTQHVKGLEPLDTESWHNALTTQSSHASIYDILSDLPIVKEAQVRDVLGEEVDEWWLHLGDRDAIQASIPMAQNSITSDGDLDGADEDETDDDEFQTQEVLTKPTRTVRGTPPAISGTTLRHSPNHATRQPASSRDVTSNPGEQRTNDAPAPRRLGVIGGRHKPMSLPPNDGVETATAVEAGKRTDKEPHRDLQSEQERPVEAAPRLGRLTGASHDDGPVSAPPRESSQERADRRRMELKRDLKQQKSPKKKKRKF